MVCSERTKELQKYLVLSYEYAKTFEAQANKEEGLNGNPGLRDILAGMRILERMRRELFPPKDEFDRIHGKDTSGVTSLRRLRIASPNKAEGCVTRRWTRSGFGEGCERCRTERDSRSWISAAARDGGSYLQGWKVSKN
jgi:hypothetical protein